MKTKQPQYSHHLLLLPILGLLAFCISCVKPSGQVAISHPGLVEIDSLLWSRPDSAFMELQRFVERPEAGSLNTFNGHCFQLLLSELLYKNDCAQTNREELLKAVSYFDSLASGNKDAALTFLDARGHYINGVGYYERDSVVEACQEYLKAVELMEERFKEQEFSGKKAQFMALAYTHLMSLFSDQYFHEQAIYYGQLSLPFYHNYDAVSWHTAWTLEKIGAHFEVMEQLDSAEYYYNKSIETLPDTNNLTFRDVTSQRTLLSYHQNGFSPLVLSKIYSLLSQAESEKEYLSRCLLAGEMFYEEKVYDSAWLYLNHVFNGNVSMNSKKQAAEWLVKISKELHKNAEMQEYANYLMPFVNLEENRSPVKSHLIELSKNHENKKLELSHQHEKKKSLRNIQIIVGVILILLFVSVLLYHKSRKRKQHLEAEIIKEHQQHFSKQKALGGRLKRSNQEIRELKNLVEQLEDHSRPIIISQEKDLLNEPICRHILKVCNNENKPIKSSVHISEYADIALTSTQKVELKHAVMRHYGWLFEILKKRHPALSEKDLGYCHLCLIGLNNAQIAAMLQKSFSSVWNQEKRLKRIFQTKNDVGIFLKGLVLDNQSVISKEWNKKG